VRLEREIFLGGFFLVILQRGLASGRVLPAFGEAGIGMGAQVVFLLRVGFGRVGPVVDGVIKLPTCSQ